MQFLLRYRAISAFGAILILVCPAAFGQVSVGIGSASHRIAEGRILHQLEAHDSFTYKAIPLEAFVQLLRDRYSINVVIDQRALEDFGIDLATPLSVHLLDATLESALNFALDSVELTWTIRDESLLITTPERAEAQLETRIYPVRDLVVVEFERQIDTNFDDLIWPITSTIHPDSWAEVGGPGGIEPHVASSSLFISQTWRVHRDIERLIATIRDVRKKQGISPASTASLSVTARESAPQRMRRYRASVSENWQVPRIYE